MNILITICAREGSKSVKDKNILEIGEKPLIAYTIETAKKWGKANEIICSTDSEKIAAVAKKYGAEVPFTRPADLASDTAGKVGVIRHALKECERIYGEKYDLIVDLDVTSPLRTIKDLDECLRIFKEKKADIVFSVTEARRNPYFNMVEINKDGFAKLSKSSDKFLRRQDAPKVYDMNASIYFYSRNFLLNPKNSHPVTGKAAIHIMDDISSTDIDSEADYTYVEYLIKNKKVSI